MATMSTEPLLLTDADTPQLTLRATLCGLFVGTLLCFTNMYFGLQTGWVTMGSIQCAVVGFLIMRALPVQRFTAVENVVVQTVGVATATMPLAGGFVGIIPALQLLDPPIVLSTGEMLLWCGALAYFGIFFAVPLRRQTVLAEKLPFPSGSATANMIRVLHESSSTGAIGKAQPPELTARFRALLLSFGCSFAVALATQVIAPPLANLRVADWLGFPAASAWHWTVRPALSYVGQGAIMGPHSALSMLGGAVVAWALLGPAAMRAGWVSDVDSWEVGAQGWVLWVALGLMLAESLTSLLLLVLRQLGSSPKTLSSSASSSSSAALAAAAAAAELMAEEEVAPPEQLVPLRWWAPGLLGSSALCVGLISALLAVPAWQLTISVLLSCVVAVLAVRALGQTDVNPASAVGKLSQIVFAFVAPGNVATNIVAGALAEAGAMQAGDLMQDLKTGHLLGASPRAQFFAQLIGSTFSVFVTVGAYQLYTSAYGCDGGGGAGGWGCAEQFGVPVAHVWLDMAVLMQQGLVALPPGCLSFAAWFGVAGVFLALAKAAPAMGLPLLRHLPPRALRLLPSGIAFGIGMYLTPEWTLPRVAGALGSVAWRAVHPASHEQLYLMVASGFVLGDGVVSIIALFLHAA